MYFYRNLTVFLSKYRREGTPMLKMIQTFLGAPSIEYGEASVNLCTISG